MSLLIERRQNRFIAAKVIDTGGILNLGTVLLRYYQKSYKVDQLIQMGIVNRVGETIHPCPLIQKYGLDYTHNPNFKSLPVQISGKLINQYWTDNQYTNPVRNPKHIFPLVKDQNMIRNLKSKSFYLFQSKHWYLYHSGTFTDLKEYIQSLLSYRSK